MCNEGDGHGKSQLCCGVQGSLRGEDVVFILLMFSRKGRPGQWQTPTGVCRQAGTEQTYSGREASVSLGRVLFPGRAKPWAWF